ncbi:SGNH/GDSL hydrolase family protein [Neolewinella persica]|uniref:SGNH/GDSL hydrolase family protein n=1 Tax=Neolewinella persica TaxID=70998 RepID=UPI00036D5CC2|nr:SGNH/GDSL hydrolase family protein [Neolewinella persica]
MRILLYLLTAFMVLLCTFACQNDDDTNQNMPEEQIENTFDSLRYLALGDSYTIGTEVADEERWPVLLAAALEARNGTVPSAPEVDVDIVAVKGWTTQNLINGIEAGRDELLPEYDLVSLLIGVNNQYDGLSIDEFEPEFEELLKTAIDYAGGRTNKVFVVSIPDYAYTPSGGGQEAISTALVRFNGICKRIADRYEVPFYNITPISQQGLEDPSLVTTDDLHPSGKQYRRWVEEVLEEPVWELVKDR